MRPYAIIDLHCDTLTDCMHAGSPDSNTLDDPVRSLSLSNLPQDVHWAQFFAVFLPDRLRGEEAVRFFDASRENFERQMQRFSDRVSPCRTVSDMERAWAAGKTAAFLSVENGSALIRVTSTSMEGAVAATEGVKEMMSAIAQASTQQLEAVSQIQESMDSLSDVVQENSAASEESAVIGEELAEQARSLKHLIDRFVLEKPAGGSDGGAR